MRPPRARCLSAMCPLRARPSCRGLRFKKTRRNFSRAASPCARQGPHCSSLSRPGRIAVRGHAAARGRLQSGQLLAGARALVHPCLELLSTRPVCTTPLLVAERLGLCRR
jgi:hypothetical protein